MILTHFSYDTIKVTYDEPVDGPGRGDHNCKEEVWKNAQVHFKHDAATGISTLELHGERDRFLLLGSAKVIELTPWGAKFETYWWSGHPYKYNKDGSPSKRQRSGFAKLVRADVVCEF